MRDFSGWAPMRIYWRDSRPMVDWGYLGTRRFTEPFFGQTINRCVQHPADLLFRHQIPLEKLGEIVPSQPSLRPTGFIFHMSRCGSTLITQMLAALERNIVISEAGPVDEVLRAHFRDPAVTEATRVVWLQWLVSTLGWRRFPREAHLFIKFDCWDSLFLPLIRKAFPDVPWIFVYRNPAEVLASQLQLRGAQMIPGVLEPALFGWDAAAVAAMELDEYGARALGAVCEAALGAAADGRGEFVNYRELPDAILRRFLPRWNPGLTGPELERAAAVSLLNAKNPVLPFEDDTRAKQALADDHILDLSRRWLEPVYAKLEAARQAGQAAPVSRSS